MVVHRLRKYVLDANCFIDAANEPEARAAFDEFCVQAAPGLHLSAVVAAELRAGAGRDLNTLDRRVLGPYIRRGRVVTPSGAAWHALGSTLATLVTQNGLVLTKVRRSFVFDILLAYSCREAGAILVSSNTRDLERIAKVFAFDFLPPYPRLR
ncbi:MAG: PIN domain-containing protein [Gemmatimonadaceae bacterium]